MELILNLRKELHKIPEPSMQEVKTKRLLMAFIRLNAPSLEVIDRESWFYAYKKGKHSENPVAFRADFDAVFCSDGCARHLCGHDGHSAVLAGFALWLDKFQPEKDVYLIFQPGEESGCGAAICSTIIEEKHIAEIYGFHNIPGYVQNKVILLNHTFACASTGLEITLIGKQSHAAYPENGMNPAAAIAGIIQTMDEIIKAEHRGIVLGTVIGIDAGSHSYGVSAGEGILRLTLRAEYQDEYDAFVAAIEMCAKKEAADAGLACQIRRIEEFPATVNAKRCVEKIQKAAEQLNLEIQYPPEPFRWSEDFGYYLQKTEGAYFGIGCGRDHPGLHSMEYEFNDGIIDVAIQLYRKLVM